MSLDQLKIALLPAELIIRGAVANMHESNYELYLTEFINSSPHFMNRTANNSFQYRVEQSHGECDCFSIIGDDSYELDLKLFGSQRALQGESIYSQQVTEIIEGAYAFSPSKEKGSILATWILAVLKEYSLNDLEMISNENLIGKNDIQRKDVQCVLKKLLVNKNLFFFSIYRFSFPKEAQIDFFEELDAFTCSLSDKLKNVIIFREKYTPRCDTFFSFIFEDKFIITEFKQQRLLFFDCLSLSSSKSFMKINDLLVPNRGIVIRENRK